MKDFDQETWPVSEEAIAAAVVSAYGRLSPETRVQTIMFWTELACQTFSKDRAAAGRYLLWLLENAEEDDE
jgi:hypothetical protein